MRKQIHTREGFRCFQLKSMGFIAIFIGPVVLFATTIIYSLPFPKSISETATISNRTAPILPFCLGALALFSLTYAIVHSYDIKDRVFTVGMFFGFTIVALQMCYSQYIDTPRVGFLGVSEYVSNALHFIGAVVGFGCMILWIMLCFMQSDQERDMQTKEKKLRNTWYSCLGAAMTLSLCLFIFNHLGMFGDDFPVMFIAECFMLAFGGIACLIKGGLILEDE